MNLSRKMTVDRLTCMNVSVLLHITLLMETLATVRTGKGSRIGVNQQMG